MSGIVSTLPMFVAHCLFDGDSFPFYEFIWNRMHLLGEAWGEEVLGRRIGPPNEHDAHYARVRSADRAERDRQLTDRWEDLKRQHGSERSLILAQTAEYASLLGLGREDLPCIACEAGTNSRCLAILRIRPEWYATDERQRILSESLRTGLGSETVRRIISNLPMEAAEMARRLRGHLDTLHASIERRVRGIEDVSPRTLSEAEIQKEIRSKVLVIDRAGQRVFAHGTPLSLTKAPFRLLVTMAEVAASPMAILSRDQAAASLWGEDTRSESALDTVVRRLRKELGGDRNHRPRPSIEIETVRGRGWRLALAATAVCML